MTEPNRSQTESIESARQQILGLVREIEMLSDSKVPPDFFFPEYLKRVAIALGADAAAVWLIDDKQSISPKHYVQRTPLGVFENPQVAASYNNLINEALQSGGVRVYRQGDPRTSGLPTPHVQIIGALQQGTKTLGVLQILQRSEAPESARAGYLQFVEQMCAYVARYFKAHDQPVTALDAIKELGELRRVILELHGSLNVNEVASIAANDGAKFLGCDRVSVLERYGARTLVRAMSGQDAVNLRANLVRQMTKLTEQVLATGERLQYSGKPEGLPPQIEEPLAEYLDVSRSRILTIVPLFRREPSPAGATVSELEEREKAARKKAPLGALVIEQVTEGRLRPDFETRLDLLTEQVSEALVNAQQYQRIPLLPLLKYVGEKLGALRGRRLAQAIAVLVGVVAVILALALVPWDYRVEGKGRLMPVERQNVFAPADGKVETVLVDSGAVVTQGQVLLQLKNEELHARWLTTSSERLQKQKQLQAFEDERTVAIKNQTREEVERLRGKIAQTKIEIEGAERRLKILSDLMEELTVRAPRSGVVATFQVLQTLQDRPVRRGELLLEIMDPTGPWHLELEIPEQRMGHVLIGQEQLQTPALPVEFVLATATESTHQAHLETSSTRSATSEQGGTVVEVFASLDADELPHRRIGAEVTGKINCGRRSLGYVLFGDVIEFIRKRLWL
ncbi:MAG: efflux RND transporter periplasmic adaptor subunit [Planctomycetales bacterium]